MANKYNVGDVVRVAIEFTDALTGAFVDPAQVRLKVRTPSLEITTFTHPSAQIIKDAVGKYRTDILLDEPGEWRVRWEGRNTNRATEEVSILAQKGEFYTLTGAEIQDS